MNTEPVRFLSDGESDTRKLACKLADNLTEGLTVSLNGELGAGKTFFTRALCAALGTDPSRVNSPTFVLLQLYTDGRIPIAHFDTYRLADPEEFLAIGADEYLYDPSWLCVVEWAERVTEILPADRIEINIHHSGEQQREFVIQATGTVSSDVLAAIRVCLE